MLLKLNNVKKTYPIPDGIFTKGKQEVLKGISLNVKEKECLGIIGESGSGKSTLGRLIIGLEKPDSGIIEFLGNQNPKSFRKNTSVVFQDYTSSVNPRFRVLATISEPLLQTKLSKKQRYKKVVELLEKVGLSEKFINRFPHELSGGQLQRVCIARAIATNPKFLLLDEAVSSLDISVQVQVLDLLRELKESEGLSYIFITHDLLTVTYLCDRVLFFKEGEIVEQVDDIHELKNVKNEYSKALLNVYQ